LEFNTVLATEPGQDTGDSTSVLLDGAALERVARERDILRKVIHGRWRPPGGMKSWRGRSRRRA